MINLGNDILKGTTVRIPFNTNGADGASITIGTNGTPYAIIDGSTTEVTTGVTLSEDFDSRTGTHLIICDTSQSGFTLGSEVLVGIHTNTIDGVSPVNAFVGRFGIQMASPMKPVVGLAQGGGSDYVTLPAAASAIDGDYEGCIVRVKHATGLIEVRAKDPAVAYTGSTTQRIYVDPVFGTSPTSTSEVEVYLSPVASTGTLPSVNTAQINAVAVGGAGTSGDPWGPA